LDVVLPLNRRPVNVTEHPRPLKVGSAIRDLAWPWVFHRLNQADRIRWYEPHTEARDLSPVNFSDQAVGMTG
jgi:hypothetical protein